VDAPQYSPRMETVLRAGWTHAVRPGFDAVVSPGWVASGTEGWRPRVTESRSREERYVDSAQVRTQTWSAVSARSAGVASGYGTESIWAQMSTAMMSAPSSASLTA
jgi:hypothetical protein